MPHDHDVAIIGGGPAGTSAAIALARGGHRVVLLEREAFPRFHIGESLLPVSNQLFAELGIADQVAAAGFVEKYGATFIDETGEQAITYDFAELTGQDLPPTYQVPRDRFDAMLLDQARQRDVAVRQAAVHGVEFDADGARVSATTSEGERGRLELRARYVIDGSGRSGFVANRFGRRVPDPAFDKVALYAHFTGVPRLEGRRAGDIRIVSCGDLGWLWFIPLPAGLMSVGVVVDRRIHERTRADRAEVTFDRLVRGVPAAAALLAGATRINEVRVEGSYSYRCDSYCGERWLLAGDAGSFIDPVFSSGVLLALMAGIEAAEAVSGALRDPGARERRFRHYDRVQKKRYWFLRRFVWNYYQPSVRDLFFAPRNFLGVLEAVTSMLAGQWDPPLGRRMRIAAFYALGRVQRFLPIAPRLHRRVAG